MRIISRRVIREFGQTEKQAVQPLDDWYRITRTSAWKNLAEVKETFPSADLVGKCIVFNIGGNKFRLITKIEFLKQRIYIKGILTHQEYDTNKWKAKC